MVLIARQDRLQIKESHVATLETELKIQQVLQRILEATTLFIFISLLYFINLNKF